MTVLVVTLTVVVALLGVLVVGLLRSHADILRALHDLGANLDPDEESGIESAVPFTTLSGVSDPATTTGRSADLTGRTPDGSAVHVAATNVPHSTLLAFLSSGCLTCREFWTAFDSGDADQLPGADTRLVVVTKGPEDESLSEVQQLAPRSVPTVMTNEAWDDYGVPVAPYFILVDGPTGAVLGEGAAATWSHVRELLGRAMADNQTTASGAAGRAPRRRGGGRRGADRAQRIDDELLAAGIGPDDPSMRADPGSRPPGAEPPTR